MLGMPGEMPTSGSFNDSRLIMTSSVDLLAVAVRARMLTADCMILLNVPLSHKKQDEIHLHI